MAKRMILMLVVVLMVIGALGFVKFRQVQTAMAEGAAFQPPPEAVTTIVAQAGALAGHAGGDRDDGRGAGRDGQRRSARNGRSHRVRIRPFGRDGARCWPNSTRVRSARSSRRSRHSAISRASTTTRMKGLLERPRDFASGIRPRGGRTEADRRAGRRDPRHDRAQDDSRAVFGRPRHSPGQPWPVPCRWRSDRPAAVAASDLRELRRAAAGGRPDPGRASGAHHGQRPRRARGRPDASRRSTRSSTRRRGTSRSRRRSPIPRGTLRPGMFVQTELALGLQPLGRSRCRHRPSVTRRSATRSSSSPISKDENGQTYRGVRQQFVKLGGARGDQIARRLRRRGRVTKS